jgi:hypothetical protein
MATSPNYGWLEPDNTDLVKNGALAIRTLGNAIDTTMATMTPKSLVDAKGDLIAATADNTPARLAVGNDGETLVADSSTSTGLRYQGTYAAGKNVCINGGFDIWQRGTSGFTSGYSADRWLIGGTQTVSRSTDVPFAAARYSLDTATTGGANYNILKYRIESLNSQMLQSGSATISFWAKSVSGTNSLNVAWYSANAQDNFSATTFIVTNALGTPSTSWTFYKANVTLTDAALTNGIEFQIYRDNSSASEFKISQVQVENGLAYTAFTRSGGTIQGELAACMRYFQVITAGPTTGINSSTQIAFNPTFSPMRSSSITFALTGALAITDVYTGDFNQSSSNITTGSNNGVSGAILSFGNFTGLTAYRGYSLKSTNQITASAEL